MALLADGLHMASHTVALGISVFAYVISRRLASDCRFAFGVGAGYVFVNDMSDSVLPTTV